ncbi:MAG: AAA family ATPase [Pseudomonadota bacterium]|nr:AAA family ATPase [Pseudomonadota bacterium]
MQKLLNIQRFIIDDFKRLPYHERLHYRSISLGNRINGILGARGTGKTTFLLKTAIENGAEQGFALYISADNHYFLENKLLDLAKWIYTETDIKLLCIDEIHKYPNWNQELKNIYDTFAKLKIVFSGSSMIDIIKSKYDLSRRVSLYSMYGYSFREYLKYYHDIKISAITLPELLESHVHIARSITTTKILKYFRDYLEVGYYPFTSTLEYETERFQSIENIVQKTIYEDITTLHDLKTVTLQTIESLYKYILSSLPGELNTNKLATRLHKDYNDVSKYLSYLNKAGLVHFMYSNKPGKSSVGAPVKMLPDNTNMIYAHYLAQTEDALIGKVRETFFINQIVNSGHQPFYSLIGDYQIDKYYFEIGGKSKTRRQLKNHQDAYVVADGILVGEDDVIPLYLFGLLY